MEKKLTNEILQKSGGDCIVSPSAEPDELLELSGLLKTLESRKRVSKNLCMTAGKLKKERQNMHPNQDSENCVNDLSDHDEIYVDDAPRKFLNIAKRMIEEVEFELITKKRLRTDNEIDNLIAKIKELEKENAMLKSLNIELQKKNLKYQEMFYEDNNNSEKIIERNHHTQHKEVVQIGDVLIPLKSIETVNATEKHSMFIKELAVMIWGKDELKNRVVCAKHSRKNKNDQRIPLSPEKVSGIKDVFRERLKNFGYNSDFQIEREVRLVNRYLIEKISDLRSAEDRRKSKVVSGTAAIPVKDLNL